jgi:hypothetical protein
MAFILHSGLLPVDAELVAAAVEGFDPLDDLVAGTAITKLSSVSRSAMVDTEDGKNCGVSTPRRNRDRPITIGRGRAVGNADDLHALLAGDPPPPRPPRVR